MLVPLPMIDAEAPRVETERLHGLQEGAVRIAGMDPEFDNHVWLQRTDQPQSKRRVPQPSSRRNDSLGIFEFKSSTLSRQRGISPLVAWRAHRLGLGRVEAAISDEE